MQIDIKTILKLTGPAEQVGQEGYALVVFKIVTIFTSVQQKKDLSIG